MSYRPTDGISNKLDEDFTLPEKQEDSFKAIRDEVVSIKENVNKKTYGLFTTTELLNNERFFGDDNQSTRSVFRKVFSIGAIAAGATLNTVHGISGITHVTRLSGSIKTNAGNFKPIPYVSTVALNQQISLDLIGANLVIVNGAGSAPVDSGLIILEYLKN